MTFHHASHGGVSGCGTAATGEHVGAQEETYYTREDTHVIVPPIPENYMNAASVKTHRPNHTNTKAPFREIMKAALTFFIHYIALLIVFRGVPSTCFRLFADWGAKHLQVNMGPYITVRLIYHDSYGFFWYTCFSSVKGTKWYTFKPPSFERICFQKYFEDSSTYPDWPVSPSGANYWPRCGSWVTFEPFWLKLIWAQ